METRTCTKCKNEKSLSEFYFRKDRGTYYAHCKACHFKLAVKNPNTPEINRNAHRRHMAKRRRSIIKRLGGECFCCGEKRSPFLTIDHIHGGGNEDRRQWGGNNAPSYYTYLANEAVEILVKTFRVACWNCNSGRHYNGGICPHEEERRLLDGRGLIPAQEKD